MTATRSLAQPPTIEQPKEAGVFRVNPVTGAPMPLESITSKVQYAGSTYYCYLPTAASTVAFPYGEPQVFMARYFGTTVEELHKRPLRKLELLAVTQSRSRAAHR